MHQFLSIGIAASLTFTSEKCPLALKRPCTGQKLSFVNVGFRQCNPPGSPLGGVGCLTEDASFMLVGTVCFV